MQIDRSNLVLEEYHLTTAEGCINHIIDTEGNHYYVPNYLEEKISVIREALKDTSAMTDD